MSYLLLTIHAYWIDKKLKKFKKEKAKSLEDDLKRKRKRRRKRWFDKVRKFLGRHTTINAFIRSIYTEDTFANYVVKSFVGFLSGFVLTYMFFIFFVFQLNFTFMTATILGSILGVFLTLGLAFSSYVRCLVLLLLPQFFSKRGRQTLIAYAFILTLTGPTKNTLHNIGVMSESLACGQEQLKDAVKQIVDLVKKPFLAIRDAIKKIVEVVKEIIVKVKNAFLALQRIIMNILHVVKSAFQWLASIINICNKKLGTPFQRCMSVFESAVEDCQAKLGPMFSWLCSIAYLVSSVCYLVKFLDYICMLLDFLSDSIVGKVTKKFKEFMNHIRTMFYVSVQFSHSFQFESNQSKALKDVTTGIVAEVRQRTDTFRALFDWMGFITSFFFLFMILKVMSYRHKYLTIDRFDNKYVTEDVRDIDMQRGKLNKETIFPLTRTEKHKFVTLTSIFLIHDERIKLAKTLLFLAHVTFKLFCQVSADYCLYWLLGTIRYYGKMQTGMQPPSMVGVNIIGLGLIADLYKGIIHAFTPFVNKFHLDPAPCLPDPLPPDIDRYIQITSLVVICWFLAIFEPYGLRIRQVVMRQYHPDRAKQRAVWLYNHILRSRGNFLKLARRQLRTFHTKGNSGVEHVSLKQWIREKTVNIYICRKIFGESNEVTCILCGTPQRHSGDKPFIHCVNYGCVGVYCEECYNQLQNKCTICLDPISYGDLSDVSEEKDSSDDSQIAHTYKMKKYVKTYRESAVSSSSNDSDTDYSYQHLKLPDTPESVAYMSKPHFKDLEGQPVRDYTSTQIFHNAGYSDTEDNEDTESESFSSEY